MKSAAALPLLVSLGLSTCAFASEPGEGEQRRPPQLAVEVGGAWTRMEHPFGLIPTSPVTAEPLEPRNSAPRLSGGLHFNLLRGSGRSDLWWTNGIDWYLSGHEIQVLAFRPGLEKRFALSPKLTLGLAAFGSAAEVSMATGRGSRDLPRDPTQPVLDDGFFELRASDWLFGAGGSAALNVGLGRYFYTRLQAGYTHYFQRADLSATTANAAGFRVSLSGPWAGALFGVSL